MERLFVGFLGEWQPKLEYFRLFSEIVIDVWRQKQRDAALLHAAARKHLEQLSERKQRLVEAFIYERAIDQCTYQPRWIS